jgi:hypothetical protein
MVGHVPLTEGSIVGFPPDLPVADPPPLLLEPPLDEPLVWDPPDDPAPPLEPAPVCEPLDVPPPLPLVVVCDPLLLGAPLLVAPPSSPAPPLWSLPELVPVPLLWVPSPLVVELEPEQAATAAAPRIAKKPPWIGPSMFARICPSRLS